MWVSRFQTLMSEPLSIWCKLLGLSWLYRLFPKITILDFLGLAYKRKVGGSHEKLKEEFPGLEQQIQLNDVMENEKIQEFFRQHFRAFLHYLEDTEPALTNHTGYMKKMHKHILKGTGYFLIYVYICTLDFFSNFRIKWELNWVK